MSEKNNLYQEASRDIYNISGSQYIINNPIIQVTSDKAVTEEMELKFKELKKVDYLRILKEYCSEKKIISRESVVRDIYNALDGDSEMLIYGEPGIGKTIILSELAKDQDAVYISLRDKSLNRVVKYLIDSFEIQYGYGEDDIMAVLETLLQTSEKLFLIDDCESNPQILHKFLSIEKFRNIFVYASRIKSILGSYSIKNYEVKPFVKDETEAFIKQNIGETTIVEFQDLVKVSQGNPLYLYYFSKYQISPLPKDLGDYQQAIWNNLGTDEKELLNCIATTTFPIELTILKGVFDSILEKSNSPMQIMEKINRIEFLLRINERNYEIFHPSFKEYLLAELDRKGLIEYYKSKIGYVCLEKDDYIEATILLKNIDSQKIKPYIFETSHYLYFLGYIELSAQILEVGLSLYDREVEIFEFGYANYHLSSIYKDLGDNVRSFDFIEEAIASFKTIGDEEFHTLALTFKAQYLAEEGIKEEALEVLGLLLSEKPKSDLVQASIYLNVSKTYLSFNQYKLAAAYAKKSYELFSKMKDKRGMHMSILNYSASLGNINEEDLALEYLENLLEDEEIQDIPQLKAGVLNNLTMCYRKKGRLGEAKKACLESIEICRKLNLNVKVSMNLLNLGNVYRDEKDFQESEKLYKQGLDIAKQSGCKREIGRAQELLANIYNALGKYDDAILYASDAINESSAVKDSYRVAEAYIERAKAHKSMSSLELYVQDIDKAVINYLDERFVESALYYLFESSKTHFLLGNLESVKTNIDFIEKVIQNDKNVDFESLADNLEDFKSIDDTKLMELYSIMFARYLDIGDRVNLIFPFINFVDLCLANKADEGKQTLLNVLNKIIDRVPNNDRLMNLLAYGIEQSGTLLDFEDVEEIIKKLVDGINGFYYREISDGTGIFTVAWDNGFIAQINSTKLEIMEYKIALSIALVTKCNCSLFCERAGELKERSLEIYVINYDTFNKEVQQLKEESFPEPVSAVFSAGKDYDVPTVIIPHKNYADMCDFSKNPDNKAFVWILMNLYRVIVSHLSHLSVEDCDKILAKDSRVFVEKITGINYSFIKEENWRLNEISK
ncbi:tetratricopeptide repeat protein [Fusibacter ferrireducens]|uniref:Tetratricopeptide repeat protein n=1 Tax=Fusibacter ferrireducens TaxID=2785058 RepID=A0ABR9ZP49_9FIRM|nr:tetratricopeptide repeat protein [Fusibacter ferrireducens]MBF4692245.1 tetratricopeptide repeat protein [Fusibacter ferrireducens]